VKHVGCELRGIVLKITLEGQTPLLQLIKVGYVLKHTLIIAHLIYGLMNQQTQAILEMLLLHISDKPNLN
jgi:hypothetical protein